LLSILTVYFQDIKFIWQVVVQAGFFISGIFFTIEIFPENIRALLSMNPMLHVLEITRDLVLYGNIPAANSVIFVVGITAIIFVIGYVVFKYKSGKLAEDL